MYNKNLSSQLEKPKMSICSGKHGCSTCGKIFKKHCLLQRHIVVHSNEKPFHCESCKRSFSQKSSLQRHYHHQHMGEKFNKCPKCKLSFAQKSNLISHLKSTHPLESPSAGNRFACDYCACTFAKLNSLNRHKVKNHNISESARLLRLEKAFQDEAPVDDAAELANNVLQELKKLQKDMGSVEYENVLKEFSTNEKTKGQSSQEPSLVVGEIYATSVMKLVDKLNPLKKWKTFDVQCIKRDDGVNYYVCDYCAKDFRKSYDLIRHRRTHSCEKPYNCGQCSKAFITKSKLEAHKKVHLSSDILNHTRKQYSCSICIQKFDSIRKLDSHSNLHHQTHSLLYVCSICSRTFNTLRSFSKHKHASSDIELKTLIKLLPGPINISEDRSSSNSIQKTNDRYHCNKSSSKFHSSVHVQHEKAHHHLGSKFKCNNCARFYSTKSALNLHLKIHSSHDRKFACEKCIGKKFTTKAGLKRHMLTHNLHNFKCAYCEKTFKTKENCKCHMKLHLKSLLELNGTHQHKSYQPPAKVYQLVVQCTKTQSTPKFIEIQMLPKHQKHSNITIESMPSTPSNIQINTGGTAKIEKNLCSICQRSFQKPIDLKRHLRTHTKERPFSCELCSKSFALQSTLKEHLLIHSEKRPSYDCQVCGKHYSSKKVLIVHLRLHTGEHPFSCEFCEKTFRTSGHRKAHINVAHEKNKLFRKKTEVGSLIGHFAMK